MNRSLVVAVIASLIVGWWAGWTFGEPAGFADAQKRFTGIEGDNIEFVKYATKMRDAMRPLAAIHHDDAHMQYALMFEIQPTQRMTIPHQQYLAAQLLDLEMTHFNNYLVGPDSRYSVMEMHLGRFEEAVSKLTRQVIGLYELRMDAWAGLPLEVN